MAGANGCTALGAGYVIVDESEPSVTVVRRSTLFQICIARTKGWKEIVAEVAEERWAYVLADTIRRETQ